MAIIYPPRKIGRFKLWLGFSSDCLHKKFGADLGRRFHKDPVCRVQTVMEIDRAVHAAYGKIGLGYANPFPRATIEPFGHRFIPAMYGCECDFRENGEPWAEAKPLTPEEVDALPAWTLERFERSEPVREVLDQARVIRARYDTNQHAGTTEFNPHYRALSSLQNLGSVINTGISVMGNDLLVQYIDNPGMVRKFYRNVADLMLLCLRYFPAFDREPLTDIFVGNCSVAMIAPAQYMEVNFESDLRLATYAREIGARFLLHQDSAINPHLENYARLGYVQGLDVGQDTDFERAYRLFPDAAVNCILFPHWVHDCSAAEIRAEIRRLMKIGVRFREFSFSLCEIDAAIADEKVFELHDIFRTEAAAS
jgi:uroporphyrinogen-III decarboxylase